MMNAGSELLVGGKRDGEGGSEWATGRRDHYMSRFTQDGGRNPYKMCT